jgi:hypothetical protein
MAIKIAAKSPRAIADAFDICLGDVADEGLFDAEGVFDVEGVFNTEDDAGPAVDDFAAWLVELVMEPVVVAELVLMRPLAVVL